MTRGPRFVGNEAQAGFCFLTVTQFIMAWTAFREGHITLKELRVYFALTEMKSRLSGARGEAPPQFSARQIRALVGGAEGERGAVKKLLTVGLLRDFSKSTIDFATDPRELRFEPETLQATLALIATPDRRMRVPRRIIPLIASGGARRTLIATILGHLIRCLFYKRRQCHPKGCVKASWISERAVKWQRHHLVALGLLIPQETSQQTLNLQGLSLAINLAWDGSTKAKDTFDQPTIP